MLHRAIWVLWKYACILIEQHSQRFPIWLTPIQVFVCTITEKANEYALSLINNLENHNIRCDIDLRNEKNWVQNYNILKMDVQSALIVGEKKRR